MTNPRLTNPRSTKPVETAKSCVFPDRSAIVYECYWENKQRFLLPGWLPWNHSNNKVHKIVCSMYTVDLIDIRYSRITSQSDLTRTCPALCSTQKPRRATRWLRRRRWAPDGGMLRMGCARQRRRCAVDLHKAPRRPRRLSELVLLLVLWCSAQAVLRNYRLVYAHHSRRRGLRRSVEGTQRTSRTVSYIILVQGPASFPQLRETLSNSSRFLL